MKIKTLIKKLQKLPQDERIYIASYDRRCETHYLENVRIKKRFVYPSHSKKDLRETEVYPYGFQPEEDRKDPFKEKRKVIFLIWKRKNKNDV